MIKTVFIFVVVIVLVGGTLWLIYQRSHSDVPVTGAGDAVESPSPSPQTGDMALQGIATPSTTPQSESNPVKKFPDGLEAQDVTMGTGAVAQPGMAVAVHYTGWLTNGTKFDSSVDRGTPFSFVLGKGMVIEGWDEGVAGMRVGGKRKLIVPPSLGYGDQGQGGVIPPNATLLFDVELLDVQAIQ